MNLNEVNAETIRLIDEVAKNAISQAVKKGVPVDKIRESVDPKYWPYIDESVALDLSTRKTISLRFGRRSKRRSKRRTRKSRKSKKRKSKKRTRKRSVKRKRSKK